MTRNRMGLALLGLCGGLLSAHSGAAEPPAAATAESPEIALLKALATNPATAPYRFSTTTRGGKLVLSGRVGTKLVHDIAVRTAIDAGFRIEDNLVIDTAQVYRAAAAPMAGYGVMAGPGFGQVTGTLPYPPPTYGLSAAGPPFLYPPPLFGRYDDPFWGFEPPVISYPPWWGEMSAQRLRPEAITAPLRSTPAKAPADAAQPADGAVNVDIDPLGVAKLTGTVPTEADRVAIGERVAQSEGVTDIINNLVVDPNRPTTRADDRPPPPPVPAGEPPASAEPEALAPGAIVVDADDRSQRLIQALARRPDLAGLPIRATVRDGRATLSGKVPTAYEAMLAYRAAQQMPGVSTIDDRLEFSLPDGAHKNPLLKKGRPEDVEPYLEAQIRRQVGDRAHIDRVRLLGDALEVRGTVTDDAALPRVEATLRSIPLLRGFDLQPRFQAE